MADIEPKYTYKMMAKMQLQLLASTKSLTQKIKPLQSDEWLTSGDAESLQQDVEQIEKLTEKDICFLFAHPQTVPTPNLPSSYLSSGRNTVCSFLLTSIRSFITHPLTPTRPPHTPSPPFTFPQQT